MNPRSATSTVRDAGVEYAGQLEQLSALQRSERGRDRAMGAAKLAVAACALAAGILAVHQVWAVAALLGLVAIFAVLFVAHERLLQRIQRRGRIIQFYEHGIARLNDAWAGHGPTGERYADPAHVYARDLDLFGNASLFQYLCTARTGAGEGTLAQWLIEARSITDIPGRQAAVRDLAGRLQLREQLASAGETARAGIHEKALSAWGLRQPVFTTNGTRVLTTTLAALWFAAIAAWIAIGTPLPLVLISVLNFAYSHNLRLRLDRAAGDIEKAAGDLRLWADILALIENSAFAAPLLAERQAGLALAGKRPSVAIRELARMSETIQSRHSLFARPLDLVTFWSAQLVFVAEKWQRKFGPALGLWIDTVGEFEAFASLATFAFEHPGFAYPELVLGDALFEAEGLRHPLLSAAIAVENDVTLGQLRQLMILSGPNMAGKSTFIRSVGINAVLALCGAPVCARSLKMSPLRVAASICILDSLSGGISRFYAEIQRIKVISDMAEGAVPVLFLLDELLSGTNSHDRFTGTQFVLQILLERKAIGIVSTHDLALARIPDAMDGRAFNAHFEDRLELGRLIFDYKLKPGIVQTSNALKLMRSIGLGVSDV